MLCFSTDIYEDMQYLQEGLQDGILSEKRLDAAVTRVLAMKAALEARTQETQKTSGKSGTQEVGRKNWRQNVPDDQSHW